MVFGLLVAWVLVRYPFPGRALVDALVDLPFALPTAVAGIALTAVYRANGWLGRCLEPLGIQVAFTPLGIVVALTFIGLPFVVRTVQPVLEDLEPGDRGGGGQPRGDPLADVPPRDPAGAPAGAPHRLRAGLRARARRIRLGGVHLGQHADEDGDHAAADHDEARAVRLRRRDGDRVVMLVLSFVLLLAINVLQAWAGSARRARRPHHARDTLERRARRADRAARGRSLLTAVALAFLAVFLLRAAGRGLREAFANGIGGRTGARSTDPEALAPIRLTLLTAAVVVPLEPGLRRGRGLGDRAVRVPRQELLITLIDLPFAVSPVISGLVFVLLFGAQGFFGPWLAAHDIQIIFAVPGIVLATSSSRSRSSRAS